MSFSDSGLPNRFLSTVFLTKPGVVSVVSVDGQGSDPPMQHLAYWKLFHRPFRALSADQRAAHREG